MLASYKDNVFNFQEQNPEEEVQGKGTAYRQIALGAALEETRLQGESQELPSEGRYDKQTQVKSQPKKRRLVLLQDEQRQTQ